MMPKPSEVRVIAGQYRGRKIEFFPLPGLRPTADRVRETVFNWLHAKLPTLRCLDAYAGSGALGIEALSRGAPHVTFIESDKKTALGIEQNLLRFQAENFTVICQDAKSYLRTAPLEFDLIFLDPPFHSEELIETLSILCKRNFFDTYLYIESQQPLAELNFQFEILKTTKAGQVHAALVKLIGAL